MPEPFSGPGPLFLGVACCFLGSIIRVVHSRQGFGAGELQIQRTGQGQGLGAGEHGGIHLVAVQEHQVAMLVALSPRLRTPF